MVGYPIIPVYDAETLLKFLKYNKEEIIKRIGEEKYYKWFECLKELLDFLVEIKKEELDIVRSEISNLKP